MSTYHVPRTTHTRDSVFPVFCFFPRGNMRGDTKGEPQTRRLHGLKPLSRDFRAHHNQHVSLRNSTLCCARVPSLSLFLLSYLSITGTPIHTNTHRIKLWVVFQQWASFQQATRLPSLCHQPTGASLSPQRPPATTTATTSIIEEY